jgi:hypothetical protein
MMRKIYFVLIFCLVSAAGQAQIFGQNPAMTTTSNVYSYINGSVSTVTWQVNSNGTIQSTNKIGSTHQVTIQWNTPGSGVITAKQGTTTLATVTVPLTTTPVPPMTTGASRCGAGTLTLTGVPQQGGNTIKWYTAATGGTGTTGTSFTTPSISTTTTYYATTYNSSNGAESTPRTAVTAYFADPRGTHHRQ